MVHIMVPSWYHHDTIMAPWYHFFSANNKTSISQAITRLEKQDSTDVDALKQKIKELEDLLNKHNASTI